MRSNAHYLDNATAIVFEKLNVAEVQYHRHYYSDIWIDAYSYYYALASTNSLMAFETVVALDAGGATLKASVASVASSSVSASVVQLANHAATPVGGSSASLILGAELAELERRRSRLNYVRPIERYAATRALLTRSLLTMGFFNDLGATASTGTSRPSCMAI